MRHRTIPIYRVRARFIAPTVRATFMAPTVPNRPLQIARSLSPTVPYRPPFQIARSKSPAPYRPPFPIAHRSKLPVPNRPLPIAHRSKSPAPNCPLPIAHRSKSPAPYRSSFQIARSKSPAPNCPSLQIAHRSLLPTHLKARFTAIWSGGRDKSDPYSGRRKRGPIPDESGDGCPPLQIAHTSKGKVYGNLVPGTQFIALHPDLSGTGPIYRAPGTGHIHGAHRSLSHAPNCLLPIAHRSKSLIVPNRPLQIARSLSPIAPYRPSLPIVARSKSLIAPAGRVSGNLVPGTQFIALHPDLSGTGPIYRAPGTGHIHGAHRSKLPVPNRSSIPIAHRSKSPIAPYCPRFQIAPYRPPFPIARSKSLIALYRPPLPIAHRSLSPTAPYRPLPIARSKSPTAPYRPPLPIAPYRPLPIARSKSLIALYRPPLPITHRSLLPTHLKARFTTIWSGGRDKSGPYSGRRKRGPYPINRDCGDVCVIRAFVLVLIVR